MSKLYFAGRRRRYRRRSAAHGDVQSRCRGETRRLTGNSAGTRSAEEGLDRTCPRPSRRRGRCPGLLVGFRFQAALQRNTKRGSDNPATFVRRCHREWPPPPWPAANTVSRWPEGGRDKTEARGGGAQALRRQARGTKRFDVAMSSCLIPLTSATTGHCIHVSIV
jgi:hypothetical protein